MAFVIQGTKGEESRAVLPALTAGAVRGALAGAAAGAALGVAFVFVELQGFWLHFDLLAVLGGALLGGTLSAADAASRRTKLGLALRLAAGFVAPILAVLASFTTALSLGWLDGLDLKFETLKFLAYVFFAIALVVLGVMSLAGAALAGAPQPGLGARARLLRALRYTLGLLGAFLALHVFTMASPGSLVTILQLGWWWLVAMSVYVAVHGALRSLYRGLCARLDGE